MPPAPDKFAELVLYVAQRSASDRKFGATKLNKILFYADFIAFARRRRAITGVAYQKLPQGPAPRHLVPVRDELVAAGRARIEYRPYLTKTQKVLVALDEPDTAIFDDEELAIVDEVIEEFRNLGAKDVSDLSHDFPGWELAGDGEDIPYFTVKIADEQQPVSPTETAEILAALGA